MPQFDHEKLNVYQVAIEFVILVDEVIEYFPIRKNHSPDILLGHMLVSTRRDLS